MESSNTTTLKTRRRIIRSIVLLIVFTIVATILRFVWKAGSNSNSSNHDHQGQVFYPFRGSQYKEEEEERISSDDTNNSTTKVITDTTNVRSAVVVVVAEDNQYHEEHNHQDTNIMAKTSNYYQEQDNNAKDVYNDINSQRQAAGEVDTYASSHHHYEQNTADEGEEYQEEAFMIDDAAYDYYDEYYYDEANELLPIMRLDNVDGDDEDEYDYQDDDYYYWNDNHEENDFHDEKEWDEEEYNNRYNEEFLNAMMNIPQEDEEIPETATGSRHLRYRRRYYGIGNRQNFCLSRGCVGHGQCYNVNCNAGCFGGRCQAGSRYNNHRNYYYRNYYRRRRRRRRYYYSNRIVCANNLGCTGTALPYCIRGFCQATNFGQFCLQNAGCSNGIYNQCINGACTGRLAVGYYDYNRIVDCVSTEQELRLRLEGNVVGNNIVVNICSPSTIFISTVITSSINNLELNCVISGTGGVLGNNCKFISQGSRNNFLRLLGSNVIIRGITFENGYSSTNGGAIDLLGSGQHRLIDCTFNGNRAVQRGGAVHIPQTSNAILINNEFNGNQALQCIDVFVQGSCRNS